MLVQINNLKNLLLSISVFSLVGCASFYDKTVDQPASYHAPQVVDQSYNIDGRFSIIAQDKNYYGNFTWAHENDFDKLALNSPLGNSVAVISVESGIATLQTKDGAYTGSNLDGLLKERMGFTLPLAYLHYWVQGIPLPDYPVENKLTSGFQQFGWNIEYLEWADSNHPSLVQVSKTGLKIKLLISNWN